MVLKVKEHYQAVSFCILNELPCKLWIPVEVDKRIWILQNKKTKKAFKYNNIKNHQYDQSWLV